MKYNGSLDQSKHVAHTLLPSSGQNLNYTWAGCHVLTLVLLLCLCFSMVRAGVGWVVYVSFSIICYFCVWPGMVLNQRQLSIVVPD